MVDYITIEDRNLIHKATMQLLALLRDRIDSIQEDINLTPMLYKRVWRAALKCSGFTPTMKDDIVFKCGIPLDIAKELGAPMFASEWKGLWTIGPKKNAPQDLILVSCSSQTWRRKFDDSKEADSSIVVCGDHSRVHRVQGAAISC